MNDLTTSETPGSQVNGHANEQPSRPANADTFLPYLKFLGPTCRKLVEEICRAYGAESAFAALATISSVAAAAGNYVIGLMRNGYRIASAHHILVFSPPGSGRSEHIYRPVMEVHSRLQKAMLADYLEFEALKPGDEEALKSAIDSALDQADDEKAKEKRKELSLLKRVQRPPLYAINSSNPASFGQQLMANKAWGAYRKHANPELDEHVLIAMSEGTGFLDSLTQEVFKGEQSSIDRLLETWVGSASEASVRVGGANSNTKSIILGAALSNLFITANIAAGERLLACRKHWENGLLSRTECIISDFRGEFRDYCADPVNLAAKAEYEALVEALYKLRGRAEPVLIEVPYETARILSDYAREVDQNFKFGDWRDIADLAPRIGMRCTRIALTLHLQWAGKDIRTKRKMPPAIALAAVAISRYLVNRQLEYLSQFRAISKIERLDAIKKSVNAKAENGLQPSRAHATKGFPTTKAAAIEVLQRAINIGTLSCVRWMTERGRQVTRVFVTGSDHHKAALTQAAAANKAYVESGNQLEFTDYVGPEWERKQRTEKAFVLDTDAPIFKAAFEPVFEDCSAVGEDKLIEYASKRFSATVIEDAPPDDEAF